MKIDNEKILKTITRLTMHENIYILLFTGFYLQFSIYSDSIVTFLQKKKKEKIRVRVVYALENL